MTSPFQSYQEFYEAEGPIYTFSNQPAIIGILVVVSACIFIYFIYMSYTMKKENTSGTGTFLSALILTSAISLADTLYTQYIHRESRPNAPMAQESGETLKSKRPSPATPFALLGLLGGGATQARRSGLTAQRRRRNVRRRLLR